MRFVDEFRDPAAARKLIGAIERLADGERHYKFMEVCGGHTHTIYRHGIEHLLPANVELVLPVRPVVNGACEMLGIDPLYVANEGKFLAVVAPDEVDAGLAAMRAHPLGGEAVVVGEITEQPGSTVVLRTAFGGTRIVDMLVGDPLPRIC